MKLFTVLNKTVIAIITVLLLGNVRTTAQVAINSDGSAADNSAMLDVKSASKGLLIPRMTTAERNAITTPAQGLMVYDSDDSTFYFYKDSWLKVGMGSSGWYRNGNTVYTDSLQKVIVGHHNGTGVFQVISDKETGTYTTDVCTSGTASSQENYAGKPASNAFDDATTTYWSNDGNLPVWLQYDFGDGNPKRVAQYRLYFETSVSYDASPDSWTFEASDDGVSWTVLDTQSGQGWDSDQWKEFSFSNTQFYRYYRINISDNKGTGDDFVSVYEMEMTDIIYEKHNDLIVNGQKVGIGTGSPTSTLHVEGTFRLEDGSQSTGKILSSDASGNASWVDGTTLNGGGWVVNGNNVFVPPAKYVGIGGSSTSDSKLKIESATDQIPLSVSNTYSGSENNYGIYNSMDGSGTGVQYGMKNNINYSGDNTCFGFYNRVEGDGEGAQYGSLVYLQGNGDSYKYGLSAEIHSNGNGSHYGGHFYTTGSGSGRHYGLYSYLAGTGTGEKYGVYTTISESTGGKHYGIYSNVQGATNFAGYFKGRVYIDENMGIGTLAPEQMLDVRGVVQIKNSSGNAELYIDGTSGNSIVGFYNTSVFKASLGYNTDSDYLYLDHNGEMVLNNGKLGIGVTNPGYALTVGETGDGTAAIANVWNTFSDERWKTNIVLIDNPIRKLGLINGYYYNWKTGKDKSKQVGVIAQEIEKVLPEIVSTDDKGYKSVDYSKITALLIEVNKAQQKQIDELTQSVKLQNEKIETLLKLISEKQ